MSTLKYISLSLCTCIFSFLLSEEHPILIAFIHEQNITEEAKFYKVIKMKTSITY